MLSLLCVSIKIMSFGERVVLGVDLLCNDLAMFYFFIWTIFLSNQWYIANRDDKIFF